MIVKETTKSSIENHFLLKTIMLAARNKLSLELLIIKEKQVENYNAFPLALHFFFLKQVFLLRFTAGVVGKAVLKHFLVCLWGLALSAEHGNQSPAHGCPTGHVVQRKAMHCRNIPRCWSQLADAGEVGDNTVSHRQGTQQ